MPEYLTPGVYFELRDAAPPVVRRVRTDIAGFVGLAERGPLHQPVQIDSWRQFQAVFGDYLPYSYLAYAVKGFYENGGRTCFIVRVAGVDAAAASSTLLTGSGAGMLRLTASSPGTWANRVSVMLTQVRPSALEFSLVITRSRLDRESFPRLSLRPEDARYFVRMLNQGDERTAPSRWIQAEDLLPQNIARSAADLPDADASGWQQRAAFLQGGQDGVASLLVDDLIGASSLEGERKGLSVLERVDAVGIVCIPDLHVHPQPDLKAPPPAAPLADPCLPAAASDEAPLPDLGLLEQPPTFTADQVAQMQLAMIEHCERMQDRVAILEAPENGSGGRSRTFAEALDWRSQFDTERGFAALYYPWVKVVDPQPAPPDLVRSIPPCGHVAGLYARTDASPGVHKAPANAELFWTADVTAQVDDELQAVLNPEGINCLRAFPGRGLRVYGARTMSSNPDWRYVNVRRLMIMIEEAIDEATQWAVFEPHDFALRQALIQVVSSFLEGIWRQGGLVGKVPQEAFYVKCDDTNNPPESVDAGKLIVEIGVAPTIPAEFIIFRIGRTVEELEMVEV